MRNQLSGIDIRFLVKEFQVLVGGRLNRVYQGDTGFAFEIHVPSKGGHYLNVGFPGWIWLSDSKDSYPTAPSFCQWMRKYLEGAKILRIEQKELERIVEVTFSAKEDKFILVIELFGTGNLLVLDHARVISNVWEPKEWKDRDLNRGKPYKYPPLGKDALSLSRELIESALKESKYPTISQSLASDLGLGGLWAKEVCARCGLAGKEPSGDPDAIAKALSAIRDEAFAPMMYFDVDTPLDVTPIHFEMYRSSPSRALGSFSEGIQIIRNQGKVRKKTDVDKKMESVSLILQKQEEERLSAVSLAQDNSRKGELIYENYQLISEVFSALKEARKSMSWPEIKRKLKNPKVLSIDEARGEVVLEL